MFYPKDQDPPKNDYKTVSSPFPDQKEQSDLLNMQICVCGHDRLTHSSYLGGGKKRVIILDVPCAGLCGHYDCDCEKFIFSHNLSSPEGKERYQKEKASKKKCPPQTKIVERKKK